MIDPAMPITITVSASERSESDQQELVNLIGGFLIMKGYEIVEQDKQISVYS